MLPMQRERRRQASRSIAVKVIYESEEPHLTAADWMRIWLMEVTGGTEMKVNHYITFYMYNPTLHILSSIAIKAPPSAQLHLTCAPHARISEISHPTLRISGKLMRKALSSTPDRYHRKRASRLTAHVRWKLINPKPQTQRLFGLVKCAEG